MGHSEAASGLCSLAKIIISLESGKIPRNLHFSVPNPNIPALLDGKLQVYNYLNNCFINSTFKIIIVFPGCWQKLGFQW